MEVSNPHVLHHSVEGISPTDEKVKAIKQAPHPENSTQLRAFLGMANYHGKFIRNLSSILQPLNQLLHKEPPSARQLSTRQRIPSTSHVLVHYDPGYLWSLKVAQVNTASEQSYFTVSPTEMRDLSPTH